MTFYCTFQGTARRVTPQPVAVYAPADTAAIASTPVVAISTLTGTTADSTATTIHTSVVTNSSIETVDGTSAVTVIVEISGF